MDTADKNRTSADIYADTVVSQARKDAQEYRERAAEQRDAGNIGVAGWLDDQARMYELVAERVAEVAERYRQERDA